MITTRLTGVEFALYLSSPLYEMDGEYDCAKGYPGTVMLADPFTNSTEYVTIRVITLIVPVASLGN